MPTDVLWRSERFEELARALLASLGKAGFQDSAVLWHRQHGFDGQDVPDDTARAVQAALRFAVLDANDQSEGSLNRGMRLATAENATMHRQPVDEDDGSFTVTRGGALNQTMIGGWRIGEQPPSLPDSVVAVEPVRVCQRLAASLYTTCRSSRTSARRVRVAVEWHAAAMANAEAVSLQQRIIALKTGFESLLGTSDSRECARLLRELFESATKPGHDLLPWAGILWSPRERVDLKRAYRRRDGANTLDVRSEVEDWFMALADARNAIIHRGAMPDPQYAAPVERPLSRYAGHLFWRGERLLREAIKAKLGTEVLLCGLLAEQQRWNEVMKALLEEEPETVKQLEVLGTRARAKPPSPPSDSRSLDELLAALGCPAANRVLLRFVTSEGPLSRWAAKVDGRELLVDEKEKAILEAAGAEEALRDWIELCP
ncbi:MAG: hypothetical protein K0R38_6251 [Polyangiaceae bacterium]|jgi:hypothetical protein|nr:hypothetical protein [Polyangiaceae bacterium]